MGLKHLLIDAKQEITGLRRRNEVLEAQQAIVEVFAAALGLKRNEGGGMAIDVAWMLQKEIDDLELSESPPPTLGAEEDARRLRWLCQDHDDPATRLRRDAVLLRMPVISHSAACAAIDAAIRECS